VAQGDNYHTILFPKKVIDLEIFEESPMYFKLAVKDLNSPVKFQLVYKESEYLLGRKPDLIIYFSFTNKQPSA
jgi:hypothetical protein